MTRTQQRSRNVGSDSARERVHGHDFDEGEARVPPARIAHGTPWPAFAVPPASAPAPFLDEDESLDVDLTEPVPLLEIEPERLPGSPLFLEIDDVGTRTLMGVGARAVRAVAKSGLVEARAARGQQSTAEVRTPTATLPGVDSSAPARVIVSLADAAPARPVPPRPDAPPLVPAAEAPPAWALTATSAELAEVIRAITPAASRAPVVEPPPEAVRTMFVRGSTRAKGKRASRSGSAYRLLGLGALVLVLAALAAYVTAAL